MSDVVDPEVQLADIERKTADFVKTLAADDERVAFTEGVLRQDAKDIQVANQVLTHWQAEEQRIFEAACESVYKNDAPVMETACEQWNRARAMVELVRRALKRKHEVILPAHRIDALSAKASHAHDYLQFTKLGFEKCQAEVTSMSREMAEKHGGVEVTTDALEEWRRRVAGAATSATDCQAALDDELRRQHDLRQASQGTVGYQNPA